MACTEPAELSSDYCHEDCFSGDKTRTSAARRVTCVLSAATENV